MPTSLNCPTCGAPLQYDGGPDRSLRCAHCGNTVVVPEEFQTDAPAAAPQPLDLGTLLAQAGQWGDLAQLVKDGQKIEAIKRYRELTGVGLKEAKDAIEELAAGRMISFAQNVVSMSSAPASMEEVQAALAAGNKIEAIKLYRQMTGLGLKESKDAIEAWGAGELLQDAPAQTDLSEIRNLIAADKKLEAIQRYRETTGADLKEAKDVVDALAAGQAAPPLKKRAPQPVFTKQRPTTRPNPLASLGCVLLPLLFVGGIFGAIFWGWPLRTSGSFNQALEAAQNDARVTQAFGGRVERGLGFIAGEISCGGGCSANYTIPIQGPNGSGEIWVRSDSTNAGFLDEGTWKLNARVTGPNGEVIALGPNASEPSSNITVVSTLSAPEIDATAGAKARATREAEQTATAEAAQSTATAEAIQTAEASQRAAATAEAQATAQIIFNAQANWQTQLISDTFNSNANGWPTERFDDGSLVLIPTIEDGLYRWDVRPASGGHYWNILPGAVPAAQDFVASVDVRLASGGEGGLYVYGLAFRAEGQDYGFFGLTNTGSFRVLGVYGSTIYQFYDFESVAINLEPGAVNRLTVRALGQDFSFEINGQTVMVWNQPDLNDGRIGLGADIGREGTDAVIEFDNFQVTGP